MNYTDALNFIHGAGRFSSCAGLERIKNLLDVLSPDISLIKFIHIAGTNGKGSTCAMIDSILRSSGYKVGLFTSPYLVDFCERIQIDRKCISHEQLAKIAGDVFSANKRITEIHGESANEFELITAIALVYFAEEKCDFVVWETGLGGAKDATNIIPPPLLAIITSVSFDHMAQLGSTLREIAGEKAGIIKHGTKICISGENPPEVLDVIKCTCEKELVPFIKANVFSGDVTIRGINFQLEKNRINLPLTGKFQLENAAVAVTAANCLAKLGYKISGENIVSGIKNTVWPGRMELLRSNPTVILDCAHNEGGIKALFNSIKEITKKKKIVVLAAMMADKDYKNCFSVIADFSSRVYITKINIDRCLEPQTAADIIEGTGCDVVIVPDPKQALERAIAELNENEILVICGSIYLAGMIRPLFFKD